MHLNSIYLFWGEINDLVIYPPKDIMNQQKRKKSINSKTNIRVIREGNLRLSDRRPARCLSDQQPKTQIHSSLTAQNSLNSHANKTLLSEHHSFHSANEADRLLDLSASSTSSMSVKSCFGSFGTLKVKVPVSSLREVQNLPENLEIPLNSTSTPRSLSPECGLQNQVVEKHSPCKNSFPFPPAFDSIKNGNPPDGLSDKTAAKKPNQSDMFSESVKHKQPEIIKFSEQTSENSLKPDVLISDCAGSDSSEVSRKTAVSDQNPRPVRIHQGSVSTGKMLMQKKIPNNNNNVKITNFSSLDSLAARKALLTKKTQNNPVSVRRTVPAKVITSTNQSDTIPEKKDLCHSCQEKSVLPDAVSAVAAATAAALSTQPLISSQNKLESQLSVLLEKINMLEQEATLKQKELENESKTQKINKLETQLNQVTDERMKHLEELQKQLFGMQTKFLNVAKSFEKMSGIDMVKSFQPETKKPNQVQDEKDAYLNSSLNSSIGQEIKDILSMSSGYQTLSVPLDQQNSITEDKASIKSFRCENMDSKSVNSEKICTTKDSNINNSGKLNTNNVGHHRTVKNIYAPFLVKKPKVQSQKVTFHGKTPASSMISKSKENFHQKSSRVKEASKNIVQKKTNSARNKVGSQQQHIKEFGKKHSKEKQNIDVKNISETRQPFSVPVSSRYSILKDSVGARYSQQPYAIQVEENIPKSTTERILNTSYTIDQIVEKEDANKEHLSEVATKRPESIKEAPLEKYLLQSPDKSLLFTQDKIYSGKQPSLPSAEVLAGQEVLRKAQTSRMVLEANFHMAERDQEKDAVYGLVDNLCEGNPAVHRLQLRRKVDQCIAKVQNDIKIELSQSLHSPPNKRKSQKSTQSLNNQKVPADKLATKKFLVNKDKCQDSGYLAQVFGKAAYQNKRTTVKNPYLHFQNQTRTKSPRPKEIVPVKGVQMRSAKTQTPQEKEEISKTKASSDQRAVYIESKKYFFASVPTTNSSSGNLQHGHLGYMAVALREPRMDSGLKVPVTIRAGESLTMAPEDQPKIVPASNVMVCNIPVCDEEHVTKKRQVLVKQTLPCVVIEAKQETSKPCNNIELGMEPSAEETKKISLHNLVISDEDSEDDVGACSESSKSVAASEEEEQQESLIIFSGSNPEVTGSKTRKPAAELVEKKSQGDILDTLHDQDFAPWIPLVPETDSSRQSSQRNSLQKEALQWIEQEILSQILSHHSCQPPLPSSDFVCEENDAPQNNTPNFENDATVPSGLKASTNSSPFVDKALISQLVEELLVDKVNAMIKEALGENIHHSVLANPASPQNESASTPEKLVPSPQTPELTPNESEDLSASLESDVPLPQTPSASPESVLEDNSPIVEASLPNVQRSLFHAALKQEIDKLKEEENFKVTHTEEAAARLETVVTPQQTPSLTPVPDGSPITPVSSPVFQPELLNENSEQQWPVRTPSPSTYSRDSSEVAGDNRHKDELQLTGSHDIIPPLKEATQDNTSLKDVEIATVKTNHSMENLESASEGSSSVPTTSSESETIFESLSVGQWLLSKSEGQAADFGISEKAYQQILNDASSASTLRDTEDLFQDETTEITYSEGEVVYNSRVPPEKDPILELVSQIRNRNPLTLPTAILLQSNNDRSFGELPMTESELDLARNPSKVSTTDTSLKPEGKSLKSKQSGLAQVVASYSDLEEENLSEKDTFLPQKGTRIIEVGRRMAESSAMESVSSKADLIKWKGIPSRIEVGSISDSDQINFVQKSVRFSEDSHLTSADDAVYLDSSSDLEKLSTRSSHESVPFHGAIFQQEPEQRRQMSVMIPQPDNIVDEEDVEEISFGEEK